MGSKLEVKRGAYGKSKVKAFTVLSDGRWYPSKQLCIICGISYPSLGRTLSRWERFGYVTRQPILLGGRYEYRLEPKGRAWLRLAAQYLPNYRQFIEELTAWQRMTDIPVDDLLSMPFDEFIVALDEIIYEFKQNSKIGAKRA